MAVLILMAAIGASIYYWLQYYQKPKAEPAKESAVPAPSLEETGKTEGLGGQVGKAITNPLENMPSVNPIEKVVNPFEEPYKNPFK